MNIVRQLLCKNVEIDAANAAGQTAAALAVERGHLDILQMLLDAHADPTGLLTAAAASGRIEIAQCLVLGAVPVDINEEIEPGQSPLLLAEQNKHEALALFLRVHGASTPSPTTR